MARGAAVRVGEGKWQFRAGCRRTPLPSAVHARAESDDRRQRLAAVATSVVVVGGGVIGLSTALNLLELGARDVVLIEANQLGSGSSGLSVGVIETQYLDHIDIVM